MPRSWGSFSSVTDSCWSLGQLFRSELAKIDSPFIELIRGKGLLNAIVIKPRNGVEAWNVCEQFAQNGLLAKPTHRHIIRLAPPLPITREQLMEAVAIIRRSRRACLERSLKK